MSKSSGVACKIIVSSVSNAAGCHNLGISFSEIAIDGVDFFFEKTQDEHHTDEFESDRHLVVRRGADLNFQVNCIPTYIV